jgi:hypothetical protein
MQVKQREIEILPDGRLDSKSTSRYSGVSEATLASMRSRGEGPPYVKQQGIWYYVKDLDEYFRKARIVPAAREAESTAA